MMWATRDDLLEAIKAAPVRPSPNMVLLAGKWRPFGVVGRYGKTRWGIFA
jgi:hypothetical protein